MKYSFSSIHRVKFSLVNAAHDNIVCRFGYNCHLIWCHTCLYCFILIQNSGRRWDKLHDCVITSTVGLQRDLGLYIIYLCASDVTWNDNDKFSLCPLWHTLIIRQQTEKMYIQKRRQKTSHAIWANNQKNRPMVLTGPQPLTPFVINFGLVHDYKVGISLLLMKPGCNPVVRCFWSSMCYCLRTGVRHICPA